MNSKIIFQIGKKTVTTQHLTIFSILCLSFTISFLVRIGPLDYGWELNEFDPFFNYRATEYILQNGLFDYLKWNDNLSWYPQGRDIAATSQVALHVIAATTYLIFGSGINLYHFTIIFPVIVGSLTCFVIFGVTKNIFGITAGLFSALFFSISIPILVRGTAGWFKSEPLGLLLGLLAIWLFLSSINEKNIKISIIKIIFSAVIIFTSLSAWGGNQFFIVLIGLFIIILSLVNNKTQNSKRDLIIKILAFVCSVYFMAFIFERPGTDFLTVGMAGLSIIFPTLILISCTIIENKSSQKNKRRNCIIFVMIIILIPIFIFTINDHVPGLPSFRYQNAINPFLTSNDPLVDSISEHSTVTINMSFLFHTIFLIFSGFGIWIMLHQNSRKLFKNEMLIFTLIIGIFGVYLGSTFVRLEVFTSISLIIISSIGISILIKNLFSIKNNIKQFNIIKIIFCSGLIILFLIPLTINTNNVVAISDIPPTILSGGTSGNFISNDWLETLFWIKNNTEKDAIFASWWDYGYWIETLGERTTLADNATLSSKQIKKIADALFSSPETGWQILSEMESDYFVLFLSGEKIPFTGMNDQELYLLQGGGDETKKFFILQISEQPVSKFLFDDGFSGNDEFWNNTLMGKLIPFSIVAYVNPENSQQFVNYVPGTIGIYEKKIKFDNDQQPFELVYSSPGFNEQQIGEKNIVLVYKINKNYNNSKN